MSTKSTLWLLGVANILVVLAQYFLLKDPMARFIGSCLSSFAAGFCLSSAMTADE